MSKLAAKPKPEKPKRPRNLFKPDIRVANAVVGAIAFLQKAGLHATPKVIRRCIQARSKKNTSKSLQDLSLYLNRGVELGILRKWQKSFKIGDFCLRKRPTKKRKTELNQKQVEVIKDASKTMRESILSGESSERSP